MDSTKPTIAIAGAGDMAKFLVEEIEAEGTFQAVVLSREKRAWFTNRPSVQVRVTDYSTDSVRQILDETRATALWAFWLSWNEEEYVRVHNQLLDAMQASQTCKRYHGSELVGDVQRYPDSPRHYIKTRGPIRQRLAAQTEIQYTTIVLGTFLDYMLPSYEKTYLKDYGFPPMIEAEKGLVRWPADPDVHIGFTACRDVMKTAVRISKLPEWEPYYYIVGQNFTHDSLTRELEQIYGRPFTKVPLEVTGIPEFLAEHPESTEETLPYEILDWYNSGSVYVPDEDVMEHREKYFQGLHFRTLADVLEDAKTRDII